MKKKSYRLGFIGGGLGSIAGSPHFIASQMDDRFTVAAGVFSSHQKTNKETAEKWEVNEYSNCIEMIKDEKLDVVSILTPTPLHFENIKTLLDNNIPVICEKPLVSSVSDAEYIEAHFKDNFLVVTNNYSGYPMVRELKSRIEQGDLGDILNIRLQMPQETFLRPPKNIKYPQKWRLKDDYIPMICLDLGAHLHHLMFFLAGKEPGKLMAEFNSFSSYDVIDDVNIWMEFNDQSKASMWMSKAALGHRNGLAVDIYGTKGSASWIQVEPEILKFSYFNGSKNTLDRGGDCIIANQSRYSRMTSGHPAGFIEAFANVYSDIADCLDQYNKHGFYKNQYVFGLNHAANGLRLFHNAGTAHKTLVWQNNQPSPMKLNVNNLDKS